MNNDINIQFKLALRYAINSDLDKFTLSMPTPKCLSRSRRLLLCTLP